MVELYIVRHGETTYNIQERIQGNMQGIAPLTPKGILQAHAMGRTLAAADISFDVMLSSDLLRAKQTSYAILSHIPFGPLQFLPELRERGCGDLEGLTIQEVSKKYDTSFTDYYDPGLYLVDQEGIFKTAESLQSVDDRLTQFIAQLPKDADAKALLVAHGWINSYFVNKLLEEPLVYHHQDNGKLHQLTYEQGKVTKFALNIAQPLAA